MPIIIIIASKIFKILLSDNWYSGFLFPFCLAFEWINNIINNIIPIATAPLNSISFANPRNLVKDNNKGTLITINQDGKFFTLKSRVKLSFKANPRATKAVAIANNANKLANILIPFPKPDKDIVATSLTWETAPTV